MTPLRTPIVRRTNGTLDGSFGPDRDRHIVVKLIPATDTLPDMMELRPARTRRGELVAVQDVYRFAIKCRVNRELLEKARERKGKKAERLAQQRLQRAEKRLSL